MHSQGRYYCGKCHYSEFEGKAVDTEEVKEVKEVKEEKKEE